MISFHYKSQDIYLIERADSLQHTEDPFPEVPRWVGGNEKHRGTLAFMHQMSELRSINARAFPRISEVITFIHEWFGVAYRK